MIADETIFNTAVVYEKPAELWHGQIVFNKQSLLKYTRDIIAQAQEVRPLVFVKEDGVYTLRTVFGQYNIARQDDITWFFKFDNNDFPYEHFVMKGIGSEQSAIAAAQADFNRRVLENLAHGGGE